MDEENEVKLFHSSDLGTSINMGDSNQECDKIINLSGPVLELILSYIPDKYSGVVPSNCLTFYDEIGTSSPELWKYLSLHHDWHVLNDADIDDKDPTAIYKDSFVNNYSVCCCVETLASGMCEVLNSDVDHCGFKDFSDMKFIANQDARGNYYINIYFWYERSVLMESRNDYFLRLFNVLEQN